MSRENLMCVFVLLDGRIPPQTVDLEFMEQLGNKGVSFVMVFTKMEKVSKADRKSSLEHYIETMLQSWETMPQYFLSSATSKEGQEDILFQRQFQIDDDLINLLVNF